MLMVYDIEIDLQANATAVDIQKLKDHFKTLSIDTVGLIDDKEPRRLSDALAFSVYGELGPFMMKRMVQECTCHIFPGSIVAISQRG